MYGKVTKIRNRRKPYGKPSNNPPHTLDGEDEHFGEENEARMEITSDADDEDISHFSVLSEDETETSSESEHPSSMEEREEIQESISFIPPTNHHEKINIADLPLAIIHMIIINNIKNKENVLKKLRIKDETLARHLTKHGTSYAELTTLSVEEANKKFPYYYDVIILRKINITELTLKEIHEIILAHEKKNSKRQISFIAVANSLAVSAATLGRHLTKYGTSFKELATLTTKEAEEKFTNYDKIITLEKIKLNNFTLSEVHDVIIAAKTRVDAEIRLGVEVRTLSRLLAKLNLTFLDFKDLSKEAALEKFHDDYHKSIEFKKMEVNDFTLEQIHKAILTTKNFSAASDKLLITSRRLIKILSMIPTTYAALKEMSKEKAEETFDSYYNPIEEIKSNLNKLSLNTIHQLILISENMTQTANILGVTKYRLQSHLVRLGTTYDELAVLSIQEGHDKFKYYTDIEKPEFISLRTVPLSFIHEIILTSKNLTLAAANLGVDPKSLKRRLAQVNTTFDKLSRLTKIEAENLFPHYEVGFEIERNKMERNKMEKTPLNSATFSHVHETIRTSKSLNVAAFSLSVQPKTLYCYLLGLGLSFDDLKELSPEEAKVRFEFYDKIISPLPLINLLPFANIHQAIFETQDIKKAARALRVPIKSLTKYLANTQLDINELKILSPEEALNKFSFYYYPLGPADSDPKLITLREMHEAILVANHSVEAAIELLNIPCKALENNLRKFKTSWEELKNTSCDVAASIFENFYDKTANEFHAFNEKNRRKIADCERFYNKLIEIISMDKLQAERNETYIKILYSKQARNLLGSKNSLTMPTMGITIAKDAKNVAMLRIHVQTFREWINQYHPEQQMTPINQLATDMFNLASYVQYNNSQQTSMPPSYLNLGLSPEDETFLKQILDSNSNPTTPHSLSSPQQFGFFASSPQQSSATFYSSLSPQQFGFYGNSPQQNPTTPHSLSSPQFGFFASSPQRIAANDSHSIQDILTTANQLLGLPGSEPPYNWLDDPAHMDSVIHSFCNKKF